MNIHDLLTLSPELVHLDTVPATFVEFVDNTVVVSAGAQEDAHDGVLVCVIVVLDVKVNSEVLVVQTRHVGRHINFFDTLAGVNTHLQIELKIFKEGLEFSIDSDALHRDSRETDFVSGVRREGVLVFLEDVIHVLVQPEEGRVTGSGFEMFHHARGKVELSVGISLTTQDDVSFIVKSSVVLGIGTVER